jgi:hypothetical protein
MLPVDALNYPQSLPTIISEKVCKTKKVADELGLFSLFRDWRENKKVVNYSSIAPNARSEAISASVSPLIPVILSRS